MIEILKKNINLSSKKINRGGADSRDCIDWLPRRSHASGCFWHRPDKPNLRPPLATNFFNPFQG
jgi:hypothetical protein